MKASLTLLFLSAVLLSAPVTALRSQQAPKSIFDEEIASNATPPIPDRAEGFNRAMFKFNDGLYKVTLRPLSRGYARIVPAPVRRSIGRFFHNLEYPTRFAGNLLEGELGRAGIETGRFVVNTFTSLGFANTAERITGWKEQPSDLGQAFGTWGFGHGTYLILPVLGPSSVRDGIGMGISGYYLDPPRYLQEWEYRAIASGVSTVNQSPEQMQAYDQLKASAIDPYVALRDAYSARRARRQVVDTQVPAIPAATATTPRP